MQSVKVSTRYQITVPTEARRRLGIEAGDHLDVLVTDEAIVLRKRPARPSDRLRGLTAGKGWYEPDPVTYVRRLRDEAEARDREREKLWADLDPTDEIAPETRPKARDRSRDGWPAWRRLRGWT